MTVLDEIAGERLRPWADLRHPGNRIRPNVRCLGCGTRGCVTAWGPWCLPCNVKRMDRLDARFAEIERLDRAAQEATDAPAP